ncbi:MAG: hypothetical protein WDO15_25485 [Bacteroidota bacterium]
MYTAINIIGLSVSLAICILITLFCRDELSFDNILLAPIKFIASRGVILKAVQIEC